ncbi:MAG: tRNA (adenosine(37)-N6)-dimethylallyltransferase [Candidatus Saccharimonadales bacterium]
MESDTNIPPLIVIVGSTGSGKSSLAIDLAKRFSGEVICADSRTIYKGMDIGTAKPTLAERRQVPHHLLDVSTPDHPLTVADFKVLAESSVKDIVARGKVPFLVGGTGLYIDAVVYGFSFRGVADEALRAELEELSVEDLQSRLAQAGLKLPHNAKNKRHLVRQIEAQGRFIENRQLRQSTLIIGIEVGRELLEKRVVARLDRMFADGLQNEVRNLFAQYGQECRALQTIGYQEFEPYFRGETSVLEVKQAIARHTVQYAKRQKTWFKRNKYVHYIRELDESVDLITTFLNKKAAP